MTLNRREFLKTASAVAGALVLGSPGLLEIQAQPLAKSGFAAPAAGIDRIMLTWSDDASTSQSITWRTGVSCDKPQAQFLVSTGNPKLGESAATVNGTSQVVTRHDGVNVHYHRVDLKGLKPATLYAYRVGDGTNWSEWNQFRTADDSAKPFKFIYVGDAQNDIQSLCSRLFRAALCKAGDARFVLHAGDLVETADDDDLWSEWFGTIGWAYRAIPSVPVIGNHEQPDEKGDKSYPGLSAYWRPQFALPQNGPKGLESLAYYFKYQGALFVALNGSKALEEQAKWLDGVLADNHGQTWTIVSIHQPLFNTGKDRESPELQKAFGPIFDKYKVEMVLQGHDHTYGRTHKVAGGKIVDTKADGTVYCTSVSGSKQYPWNPMYENLMSRKGTNTQLFQVISVDGEKLRYESWTADEKLFDAFEIRKNGGGSELVECELPK